MPTPTANTIRLATVAPETLTVRDQAREDATPDAELIASVKVHGIIQPPVVEPAGEGFVIITGHRRVGAAIAAGLAEIVVLVRDVAPADLTLERQMIENERRKQLTAKEIVAGYKQLELFGRTPEDIARELGEKAARVRAGLRVHASTAAADLVAESSTVDLEQAAEIADFDGYEDLQALLVQSAKERPANFARDLENARERRTARVRVAELVDELTSGGVPVAEKINWDGGYWRGTGEGFPIDRLRTTDGEKIDPLDHATCPGHAAIITNVWSAERADVVYVCTAWEANGHHREYQHAAVVEDEETRLARIAEQERAAAAAAILVANTKARREWIRGHLTTGRLRPAATHFQLLSDAIAHQVEFSWEYDTEIIVELLTGETLQRWADHTDERVVELARAGATQPLRIALAAAFATHEAATDTSLAISYFRALEGLGYQLTDTDTSILTGATTALAEDDEEDEDEE